MIYILTGNIRTGKTTALLEWSKNRMNVDGLLCPDDEFGKRYFLELKPKKTFPLEVEAASEENIISVGPFQFLKSAFKQANEYVITSAITNDYTYLIIDELGKLELKNEGLHDSAKAIILSHESNQQHHLILVVRSTLLDDIIQHYNISKCKLIVKEDLINLD